VLRIVVVAVLILAFGQSLGILWLDEDTCEDEDCSDAASGMPCPPDCPTCTCAPSPIMPVANVVVTEPLRIAHRVELTPREQFVPSPDPREILHVPKQSV